MFTIRRLHQNKDSILRLCNITISNVAARKSVDLYDESKFSSEEQTRILTILNESPLEELYKFDATKARLIKINHWRTKRGPFKLLSEILEVEGFGIKVFEKLCHSILNNNIANPANQNETRLKPKKAVVTPLIDNDTADNIKNAVSMHLTPTGLSWCKLQRQGNSIVSWNLYDFASLPKRLTTPDLVHLALNMISKIPSADAYVFETPVQLSPQAKQKMMASTSHLQLLELCAMLTALLNTSPNHNPDFSFERDTHVPMATYNRIYFLRSFLSARLFGTLVGTEMVSAIATIESLLKLKVPNEYLPCSEVGCGFELQQFYSCQSSVNKHLLGQALLLIISFMDICIYNNQISLKAITFRQKQRLL